MHILEPRQTAVCGSPPPCNCAADEECHQIGRTNTACATITCVPKASAVPSSGSRGVSTGALAGAIVVALAFLAGAVCLFLWYRKNQRFRKAQRPAFEVKPDVPASAETVLRRPNPTEKPVPVTPTGHSSIKRYSNSTINLDPQSHPNAPRPPSTVSNPFTDSHSIQTAGTEGTNVIPIALVSPDPDAQATPLSRSSSAAGPMRPVRSPDLNLEHANVSEDSVPKPHQNYAASQISGLTNRTSFMSSASYGSEFLNEAPMIITPTQGTFRQVLGVVKAEVINAPAASDNLRPSMTSSKRPSVSSPLATSSYGPSDLSYERQEDRDPFSDKHTSTETNLGSPSASVTTFGHPSPLPTPRGDWHADSPTLPWVLRDQQSRPSSMSTQAGSVIGIENATRVNVGLSQLSPDATGIPRSPYRTTMGKLVSPESAGLGVLQEQQRMALAHAQARAKEQGLNRRVSNSSVLSTSTKADSILESFPFVPPSPISNRPVRSPPVSPLGKQAFSITPASPLPSPGPGDSFQKGNGDDLDLPKPPSRHTLGLSTASQFSTASTGLGSFPFHIDSGPPSEPLSQFPGRQRASLDTLALTNDLSSYPLGVERDSGVLPYKE